MTTTQEKSVATTAEQEQPLYIGSPEGIRTIAGRTARSKAQIVGMATGVGVWMASFVIFGFTQQTLIVAAVVVVFEFFMVATIRKERIVTIIKRRYRRHHSRKRGTNKFQPRPWARGYLDNGKETVPVPVAPPEDLGTVEITDHASEDGPTVAVTVLQQRKALVAVLKIEGQGGRLKDGPDRTTNARHISELTYAIHRLTNCERMVVLAHTVPADMAAHRRYLATKRPAILPTELEASYDDIVDITEHVGDSTTYYVVIRQDMTPELLADLRLDQEDDDTANSLYGRHMAEAINGNVTPVLKKHRHPVTAVLDKAHFCALTRHLQNPDYAEDDTTGANQQSMWQPWENRPNDCLVKGEYGVWITRSYYTADYPKNAIWRDHFRRFFLLDSSKTPIVRTLALVMEFVPTRTAFKRARAAGTADTGQAMKGQAEGRMFDDPTRMNASTQRAWYLLPGSRVAGVRVQCYTTLHTRNDKDLVRAEKALLIDSGEVDIELHPMTDYHNLGLIYTGPFAEGND